jgi:hypothetical protein
VERVIAGTELMLAAALRRHQLGIVCVCTVMWVNVRWPKMDGTIVYHAILGGVEHGALRTSAADVALRRDMLRHMTRHVPVGENLARWGKSQFQTH